MAKPRPIREDSLPTTQNCQGPGHLSGQHTRSDSYWDGRAPVKSPDRGTQTHAHSCPARVPNLPRILIPIKAVYAFRPWDS